MTLSTHVLDVDAGRPAAGLEVRADLFDGSWTPVATAITGPDGRIGQLVGPADWSPGHWRLVFNTGDWLGEGAFWPQVTVELLTSDDSHHHVPLLLARHGYTTYRGS